MRRLVATLFQTANVGDAREQRRARLHVGGALLVVAYLAAVAAEGALSCNLPLALVALLGVLVALGALLLVRRGRLRVVERATFALMALGNLALIALNGISTVRLGVSLVGAVFLGLAARAWLAPALAGLVTGVVLLAALVPGARALTALSPNALPVWLDVERQIFLICALMLVFTHGFRRQLAALGRHTAELEAAHAAQLAARERLERLVAERSQELERANAELVTFASAAAHDLKAPLRHVSGFLELFESDAAELGLRRLSPMIEARELAASMVRKLDAILSERRSSEAPSAEADGAAAP